jgi:hypothetical protein
MHGFFMIDRDDFRDRWARSGNSDLFLLYASLLNQAWWGTPKEVRASTRGNPIVLLRKNQLLFVAARHAEALGMKETTLRDRMKKLESQGEISIESPAPNVTVVTIIRVYDYSDVKDGQPRLSRDVPVGNASLDRTESALRTLPESVINMHHSNLEKPYTQEPIDCEPEDCKKMHVLVKGNEYCSVDAECDSPEAAEHELVCDLAGLMREEDPCPLA